MIEEILAPSKDPVRESRLAQVRLRLAHCLDRQSCTSVGLLTWKQSILLRSAEKGNQISRFFFIQYKDY